MLTDSFAFIIPAWNDAAGIRRHLDWFGKQRRDVQIVIVDDASTDDTEALVRSAELPENVALTYLRMEENCGAGRARNAGLALARGDLVMFLDADDLLIDDFFGYMDLSPLANGADFVMFGYHLCQSEAERCTYRMHRRDAQFFSSFKGSSFPARLFTMASLPSAARTTAFPWNKVYRHRFLRDRGLIFPETRMHEDILPHWQGFLRAERFGVMNWAPPLIHHFEIQNAQRATNYVGAARLSAFDDAETLLKEIKSHPSARNIMTEFHMFCEDLFDWLTRIPGIETVEEGRWKAAYHRRADEFRAANGLPARATTVQKR